MSRRRDAGHGLVTLLAIASLVVTAGCAAPSRPRAAVRAPAHSAGPVEVPRATKLHHVVALGDSVPSGRACDCAPFPQVYGKLLSRRTDARVIVDNLAVSGQRTDGLMSELRRPAVRDALRRSDIVLVTIGANDFGDHYDQVVNGACGTGSSDCVSDELRSRGDHLTSVLAAIHALRAGRPTTVLVTGYWNVFQDGDVARRAFGASGLRASLGLTRRANAVIRSVATAGGARYVDLVGPFEHSGRDVTSLLAADGDHPDAAGHDLIARSLLRAGLPRMH